MKERDIMRLLAEQPEGDTGYGSPLHHNTVFIIMWQSEKSGGTYTELRKSVRGKEKFLRGLHNFGVNLEEVHVIEQKKAWVPDKKSENKKGKKSSKISVVTKPKFLNKSDLKTSQGVK